MEEPAPHLHRVNERDGKFEVLNDSGSVILVCGDEASATNYAVLLSEAYQRGYKVGYRDGKNLTTGRRKI
jgi:diphthamide biosynthesis methyltransferase